jgi:hypothetical protein
MDDSDIDVDMEELNVEPDELTEDEEPNILPETESSLSKEGEFLAGVEVPPGDVIHYYSLLLLHFQQSEALHKSFAEAFRISPMRSKCNDTDSLASADFWLNSCSGNRRCSSRGRKN